MRMRWLAAVVAAAACTTGRAPTTPASESCDGFELAHSDDATTCAVIRGDLVVAGPQLAHLDGIAKEDMLFGAVDRTKPNSKSLQASHIRHLNIARRHNKPVLVVEYLPEDPAILEKTIIKIRDLKFIPYTSKRALDELFLPPE